MKNVIHKKVTDYPEVACMDQIEFQYAAILPVLGIRRKELATHFIQRTLQYMILNAEQMKIEAIWELLKGAAAAAGPNTTLYGEIVEVINDMKEGAAKHSLTAYQAWVMVSSVANRDIQMPGTNLIMLNFMVNLKRFYALDYILVPTEKSEDALLIQSEKRFNWNMLAKSRAEPGKVNPAVENRSTLLNKSNDHAALIFEINANGKFIHK